MDRVLRTREYAEITGEKEQTARTKRMRGDGCPFVMLSKNRVGYLESDVMAYLQSRRFTSTAEAREAERRNPRVKATAAVPARAKAKS